MDNRLKRRIKVPIGQSMKTCLPSTPVIVEMPIVFTWNWSRSISSEEGVDLPNWQEMGRSFNNELIDMRRAFDV